MVVNMWAIFSLLLQNGVESDVTPCSLHLEIYPVPAESPDQVFIWWPQKKVVILPRSYAEKPEVWQEVPSARNNC